MSRAQQAHYVLLRTMQRFTAVVTAEKQSGKLYTIPHVAELSHNPELTSLTDTIVTDVGWTLHFYIIE